jgi:2-isopropylmalate synthase
MDATRTPLEDILQVFEAAANAGAIRLGIADSVGFIRPLSMRYLVSHIRDGLPDAVRKKAALTIHCHNDFGLASANTLAAMEEGIAYLHTCIAGFGERAGIAPFEEVVTSARTYSTTLTLELTWEKSTLPNQLKKHSRSYPVPQTYNRRKHLHPEVRRRSKKCCLNLTFSAFPPEIVRQKTMIFIGRNTGQTLIKTPRKSRLAASPRQMDELFRRIKGQESL